jgi:hypothetical protein
MKNNIICIDLTKFNNEKLKEVSTELNVRLDVLVGNKKLGFVKLFLNIELDIIVAFTTKKDKTRIVYTDTYKDMLLNMESFEIVKQPIQLDIDTVLEKITKYGIDSLSVLEKDFLDNLSKK